MLPPPASGSRLDWSALPRRVREAVESWLGEPVATAVTQTGGFSPGVAARLRTDSARRVFVKAIGPELNPDAPTFHRREARIAAALPADTPAPRLLWSHDEGDDGWVVLAYEDVEGQHPAQPWRADQLGRVLDAIRAMAAALTPSPVAPAVAGSVERWLESRGRGWRQLLDKRPAGLDEWSARYLPALADLEADAAQAAAGETLLHFDIRADNLLLTPDRVVVVDWPHARLGADWVDVVFFAPSVAMQGGPSPEELFARYLAGRTVDPAAVNAVIAAIAGFFTSQALQPPPPGLPTLRAFQEAQGAVARRWLVERTSWD
jgi:aminoglycoside phosphotransferase (APT) family kinase protein